jgi:tetratricopeptide (TPR) repeat protein
MTQSVPQIPLSLGRVCLMFVPEEGHRIGHQNETDVVRRAGRPAPGAPVRAPYSLPVNHLPPVPHRWLSGQSLGSLMPPPGKAAGRPEELSTQTIQRAIWIVLGLLLVLLLSFAAFYVSDRYFHTQERAPMELEVAYLEEDLRQEPQDPLRRTALAEAYLRAGKYAEALEQAGQVLRHYPQDVSALLVAGIAQVRLGRPEAALAPLHTFVELRKDGSLARSDTALEAAYYYLGESYVKLGRPAEAIPLLEAALLINAVDADALYQLGRAFEANGQPQAAVERYTRAVRLVPDFLEAYQAMAGAYAAFHQPEHVAYAQGMVAYCQKDYRAAVSHLERATESLPDFAPAFLGLGLAHEGMGSLQPALAAIQHALELDPRDFAAQQALGGIQAAPEMQD